MRVKSRLTLTITVLSLFLSITSHRVYADNYSLEQSIREVKQQANGRILSAETMSSEKGNVHHIKVLTGQGKVKRYRINPNNGQMMQRSSRQYQRR